MSSRYEKIGMVVSHIERSALLMALRGTSRTDPVPLQNLAREANTVLAGIGKKPATAQSFRGHLNVLEKEGLVRHDVESYWLTEVGSTIVKDLVGPSGGG